MPTTNEALAAENLRRNDLAIADLASNGGLLNPEQTNYFIDMIQEQATILPQVRVIRMNAPSVKINRIGFASRILHAARQVGSEEDTGAHGRRPRKAERSKPTTSQIELVDSEVIAEVRLPYEVLEDNIEGASVEQHVMRLIAQRAALDLEELAMWGDKDNQTDSFLALQNGYLKRAISHTVDNAGAGISPDLFATALKTLPQKYLRNVSQMRAFVSMANTINYRQKVAARQTGYGDAALQAGGEMPLYAHGVRLEGAHSLASYDSGSRGLFTFPQNLLWGIRRQITIETDRDIRAREIIIVLTMRVATQIDDVDAVVALEDI